MAKLDQKTADRVQQGADKADSGDREAIPEGVYPLKLRGVEVRTLENSKEPKLVGQPMWVWEFEIPEDHEHTGSRFWTQRILPPESGYQHADFMNLKFLEPFDALGASADTDTEDLIGRTCRGFITQIVAERGKRQGQTVNSLEDLMQGDGGAPATGAQDDDYDF